MGIDGWIYIAVGDFGFHDAVDRTGKKLTQLGGGIVRVRPDGTGMEVYTHGMRNIYDVAIDLLRTYLPATIPMTVAAGISVSATKSSQGNTDIRFCSKFYRRNHPGSD